MDWSEEGYLALSALNVKNGYIDFTQDAHYGNQALYDKWMAGNELHKGQVLFTTEAPMGNVAQVPDDKRYILSQRTIAFDVKANFLTEDFLATVLRTPTVFADLAALSSGGTAKGISQKSLASVDIGVPKDLKEQEKIAKTFSKLNGLINLHQRQTQKLTKLKTGLLQNMFPREGESVPRLRFPGFTTTWKQQKLGDIATIVGGGTPATTHSEYWNGTIDWYAPAEITNQRYVSHSQRQITQLGLEKSSAQLLPAHKTVLFTSRAGIGKMAILQREAATNQGFQSLVLHDGIDPYFIYSMNAILKKKAEKIAAGSTFLEISGSHLAHIRITIPSLSEQKQ
ncbi:MAG: restriction endonuclease subunit S, partial [Aeriscardovia sp.]|nr:restriction endonuclease subunit S [Aeriscardovia sp.]